jgi:two-component system sensor histidine kinase CreC
VSTRARLFIVTVALVGLGLIQLLSWIRDDIRPRLSATMEESLVDTAHVLAALVSASGDAGGMNLDHLRAAMEGAWRAQIDAQIYELRKRNVNLRVYVTDALGKVVYDSNNGLDEGKDYSRWLDVSRTLRGEYGARATRTDPQDPFTSTLFVAAPVLINDQIAGVLAVGKPSASVARLLETTSERMLWMGAAGLLAIIVLGALVSYWFTRPIEKLTAYARAIGKGARNPLPSLPSGEVRDLGQAFEEMRIALEGKQYVEQYVQTLTHEMKSPLSAVRGAAELLKEDLPLAERAQFLNNICSETARMQDLVERLLELAAIENRGVLPEVAAVRLDTVISEVVASFAHAARAQGIQFATHAEALTVEGDAFLLREALVNLIQNALNFSPTSGAITITLRRIDDMAELEVADEGAGIPAYALDRVFERFYSLARPGDGKKSSGIGLAIVREITTLHQGQVFIRNGATSGAVAVMRIPLTHAGHNSG